MTWEPTSSLHPLANDRPKLPNHDGRQDGVMRRPMRHWHELFGGALEEHPVVGVQAVVEWHLGRDATRSEMVAPRRAADVMKRPAGARRR